MTFRGQIVQGVGAIILPPTSDHIVGCRLANGRFQRCQRNTDPVLVDEMMELRAARHVILKLAQRLAFRRGIMAAQHVLEVEARRAIDEVLQIALAELELVGQFHEKSTDC